MSIVLEEGARFNPTLYQRGPDSESQDDTPVVFPSGTKAYVTFADYPGGPVLRSIGPEADELDGVTVVDDDDGSVSIDLKATKTIGLEFSRARGWWEVVVLPAGEEDDAYRWIEGEVTYSRRGGSVPAAAS